MSPRPNLTLAEYLSPPGWGGSMGGREHAWVGSMGGWGAGLRWEHRRRAGLGWSQGGARAWVEARAARVAGWGRGRPGWSCMRLLFNCLKLR